MLGKIFGGWIGHRVGERQGNGLKGALIGAGAGALARRAFGPVGLAVGGGYLAKKMWDRRRARRSIDSRP